MLDPNEKRRFFREQAAFPIVYRIKAPQSIINEFGAEEHRATASNLSEEGLRLFTDFELPVGAVIVLKFMLINSASISAVDRSRKMELEAEVRHASHAIVKSSYFVGAHFMHLSDSDRSFIVATITS